MNKTLYHMTGRENILGDYNGDKKRALWNLLRLNMFRTEEDRLAMELLNEVDQASVGE